MVLILDGSSEMGAHVWSGIGNLICLRHLFRARAVANLKKLCQKRPVFLHKCATCFEQPSSTNKILYCYFQIFVVVTIVEAKMWFFCWFYTCCVMQYSKPWWTVYIIFTHFSLSFALPLFSLTYNEHVKIFSLIPPSPPSYLLDSWYSY